jgi:hypothetical protein
VEEKKKKRGVYARMEELAALHSSEGTSNKKRARPRNMKKCTVPGCESYARSRGLCKAHGGGKRCKNPGCSLSDQGGGFCIRHGGGKRCQVEGCMKSAQSRRFCKAHGGGARCKVAGCQKSSQGGGCCRTHGGGPKRKKTVGKFIVPTGTVLISPNGSEETACEVNFNPTLIPIVTENEPEKESSSKSTMIGDRISGLETPRNGSSHEIEDINYQNAKARSQVTSPVAKMERYPSVFPTSEKLHQMYHEESHPTKKKLEEKPIELTNLDAFSKKICAVDGCSNSSLPGLHHCNTHETNVAFATFLLEMKAGGLPLSA